MGANNPTFVIGPTDGSKVGFSFLIEVPITQVSDDNVASNFIDNYIFACYNYLGN